MAFVKYFNDDGLISIELGKCCVIKTIKQKSAKPHVQETTNLNVITRPGPELLLTILDEKRHPRKADNLAR